MDGELSLQYRNLGPGTLKSVWDSVNQLPLAEFFFVKCGFGIYTLLNVDEDSG